MPDPRPRSVAFLQGLGDAIKGLPADYQEAIREWAELARDAEARSDESRRTANELATENERLNDLVTTQRDALRSVQRALAAWESMLTL